MKTPFCKRAFSLIEVAMAIGLLAFCMISILGLLPVTLNTSRQSIDKNAETRMLQTVRANLLQYPTSTLPQESLFYFDADGSMLPTDSPPANAFYSVTAATLPSTSLPDSQTSAKLRTARISILHIPRNSAVNRSLHLPDNGF
jgi:uncharacterized protein (TIGR02598 family)